MYQRNDTLEFFGIVALIAAAIAFVGFIGFIVGDQYRSDHINSGSQLLYNCREVQALIKDSNPPEYEIRYSCDTERSE